MRDLAGRGDLLTLNTATLGFREPIGKVADLAAATGFGSITPWRREIDEDSPAGDARAIRDAKLSVSGYCRTAYLCGRDTKERDAAVADNVKALEAAAELGADMFVAVVGGLASDSRDVGDSRKQILDGLSRLGAKAAKLGVPIALEPLHPVYTADRSLLNTTAQALQWCDILDPDGKGTFGVCLDVYHVWWDPDLERALADCPKNRLMAFHVCDWLVPTTDPLLDRGMPGDGVIDIKHLRGLVEQAGYDGPVEVEIFSDKNWWQRPPEVVASTCFSRMTTVC